MVHVFLPRARFERHASVESGLWNLSGRAGSVPAAYGRGVEMSRVSCSVRVTFRRRTTGHLVLLSTRRVLCC